MKTQWSGTKVAFLGDSVTDKCHVGTTKNYWQYLEESLGIIPLVYGVNGSQWIGIIDQTKKLLEEHGSDVDAVFVFMGTNDYNGGIPIGEWWSEVEEEVNSHGNVQKKSRRIFTMDPSTFRGRINCGLSFLKKNFPLQQIILLTPIHRGFATFGGDNIQPEETYPNDIGLYVDTYINVIKEAGNLWSVPVIDLNGLCGLFPTMPAYARFFHDADTDLLHPNAAGHERIAKTLMYQMLALPAKFR